MGPLERLGCHLESPEDKMRIHYIARGMPLLRLVRRACEVGTRLSRPSSTPLLKLSRDEAAVAAHGRRTAARGGRRGPRVQQPDEGLLGAPEDPGLAADLPGHLR